MIVQRRDPDHVYTDETARVWPGVTTILGGEKPTVKHRWPGVPPWSTRYEGIPAEVLEAKRLFGSVVHAATAYHDEGDLDESTLDAAAGRRLEGWCRYRAETGFEPLLERDADGQVLRCWIELVIWHPSMGYAGTLDRLGRTRDGVWTLPDVKTSDPSDGEDAGPQTAAYLRAAQALYPTIVPALVRRCSVHLTDDGRYRVVPHTDRQDFDIFGHALGLYARWTRHRRH